LDEVKPFVLIVDDDASHRRLMQHWLARSGYHPDPYSSGEACLEALQTTLPDAILLDLHMDGMDGIETLRRVREIHPQLPVIMLTGDLGVDSVVKAMQAGALNYLSKPVDRNRLLDELEKAVGHYRSALHRKQKIRESKQSRGYGSLLGTSSQMNKLFLNLDRVAPSNITVLIVGESGTGKELVARAIHDNSRRRKGPFIPLNCAAVPETLQESELFGHEKGAFTGAEIRRVGRFEQAHGGTLFLDEVGELSPGLQAKLLRVIQERRFYRLGGSQEIQVDVRLLAATHRDLINSVKAGTFREDLYYRLAVFEVEVPALRERVPDIQLLAEHFVERYCQEYQRAALEISESALQRLTAYRWPGNVRELQNAIERAVVVSEGAEVLAANLPRRVALGTGAGKDSKSVDTHSATKTIKEVERETILAALDRFNGNVSCVIRELGIPRTTLYRKLKKYGIR